MKSDRSSQPRSFLRQALPVALVLVVGLALGGWIVGKKGAGHADHAAHAEAESPAADTPAPK